MLISSGNILTEASRYDVLPAPPGQEDTKLIASGAENTERNQSFYTVNITTAYNNTLLLTKSSNPTGMASSRSPTA